MKRIHSTQRDKMLRPLALGVAASILAPTLAGCGGGGAPQQSMPQGGMSGGMSRPPMQRPMTGAQGQGGMSTRKKLALVAGAAALYYIYQKHKNKAQQNAQGQTPQLYQSRNGGIYYRDPRNPQQAIWVKPPGQPIEVPEEEVQRYGLNRYQGYNNSRSGQQFGGYGYDNSGGQRNAVPVPGF